MSTAWYVALEQGRSAHPSREALDALGAALRLDAPERAYLFQLAYGPRRGTDRRVVAGAPSPVSTTPAGVPKTGMPASLRRLLDALGPTPALAVDCCWDVVGCNAAFAAVLPSLALGCDTAAARLNLVEHVLTDLTWRSALPDWVDVARLAVDGLRASLSGVAPDDPVSDPVSARAATLLARLTAVSAEFRAWWPMHGLWVADRPVTHVYVHSVVGRLEFEGTVLDVRSAPGLMLLTYVPCGPETANRLRQLTSAPR